MGRPRKRPESDMYTVLLLVLPFCAPRTQARLQVVNKDTRALLKAKMHGDDDPEPIWIDAVNDAINDIEARARTLQAEQDFSIVLTPPGDESDFKMVFEFREGMVRVLLHKRYYNETLCRCNWERARYFVFRAMIDKPKYLKKLDMGVKDFLGCLCAM